MSEVTGPHKVVPSPQDGVQRRGVLEVLSLSGLAMALRRAMPWLSLLSGYAATDKSVTNFWETFRKRKSPEINWVEGQEDLLKDATSMVICLGGAATITGRDAAQRLKSLRELGPVGYVDYAPTGLKMEEIALKIIKIQRKYPKIQQFSIFCQSEAVLFTGGILKAMKDLGQPIPLEYLIMDHPMPGSSFVRDPFTYLGPIAEFNRLFGGSSEFTALYNLFAYGDAFYIDAATPHLLRDQLGTMSHGEDYIDWLSQAVKNYQTRVLLLRPENAHNDPFVVHESSDVFKKSF